MNEDDVKKVDAELVKVERESIPDEKILRFYDRLREQVTGRLSRKGRVASRSAELLLFVPDVFILLWRLSRDSRVSGKNKILLASAIAYFILPIDIIPEAIVGPIGYLDDLVFAAYVLNRMLNDTSQEILQEQWSGDGDVLDVIQRILHAADKLVTTGVLKQIRKLIRKRE